MEDVVVNKVSRRDLGNVAKVAFGTLVGSALGLFAVSEKFKGVVNDAMYWDALINFGSGVDSKRRVEKFDEVVEKSKANPKILFSYLKWLALETYATVNELPLAQKTVSHFLYGEGNELDLSKSIVDSVRQSSGWIDSVDPHLDSDKVVSVKFVQSILQDSIRSGGTILNPNINKIRDMSLGDTSKIKIDGNGDRVNEDFFLSIKRFYFKYFGSVKKVTDTVASTEGQFVLNDSYDWDDRVYDGSSLTVGVTLGFMETVVGSMGVSSPKTWLKEKMDEQDYLDLMEKQLITISDADGLLLQESGVGNSFPIIAKYDVANINIDLN